VAKQTFTFTNNIDVAAQILLSGEFGLNGIGIELLRGEQLTLAFDIIGHEGGDADDLDVRLGFGGLEQSFEWDGYMNPAIDVGTPTGTTAVIRYRNGSVNYGGTVDNVVVASSGQVPANGGVTGTSTVNSVAFTLIRSDVGYTGVLRWEEITLEATMTPVQYWSHPVWDKWHIRLQADSGDLFSVTNIRVIYEDAQTPYIRPIVLSDVTAAGGATPSLQFSFPTDLGSSGYELQGTSDLTNPAAWGPLLSNIPAGGATGTVSTVDVPTGDLGGDQRSYRIIAP
jgi:hypothetical protein